MRELLRIETERLLLVWSGTHPEEQPPGAPGTPLRLREQTDYLLFLRSATGAPVEIVHRDPVLLRDLARSDGGRVIHGRVNFGGQVGRSAFTVEAGGERELDLEVEVFPTKLDYAEDYPRLVAETQEILTALVLEYLRPTHQPGSPAPTSSSARVEWLTLLRHAAGALERGLAQVARQPQRGLARDPQEARAERVRRADAGLRRAVLLGKGSGRVAALGGGLHLRERLEERRARPTLDTPEHRWLAAQLARIRRRLAQLRQEEAGLPAGARQRRTLAEIAALEEGVVRLAQIEPLAAVAGEPPAGFASLQLHSSPGYREAYRACLLLSRALYLEGGPVGLALKDLHLLYEYWCYLTLVRVVAEALGQPLPARALLAVEQQGLRVRLRRGREQEVVFRAPGERRVVLAYNPRFAGEPLLVPQQPDILLAVHAPGCAPLRAVLDAKYRLDSSPAYLRRYGAPGPPEEALNDLHRYRDALRPSGNAAGEAGAVLQAIALFPHHDPPPHAFRASRLWRAIGGIGVGAIPLLPGSTGYLAEWVRGVVGEGP